MSVVQVGSFPDDQDSAQQHVWNGGMNLSFLGLSNLEKFFRACPIYRAETLESDPELEWIIPDKFIHCHKMNI